MPLTIQNFDTGAGAIASAFSHGMDRISEAMIENRRQADEAKAADATFKMIAPMMEQSGAPVDPDIIKKFAGASNSQKTAMLGQLTTTFGMHMQAQQAERAKQLDAARIADYQAQSAQRKQATEADAQAGPAFGYFSALQSPSTRPEDIAAFYDTTSNEMPTMPRQMDRASALAAMAERYPLAAASPRFDNLIRYANADRANSVVEGKTASGTPYVTYGNTFQFDPQATTQMRADAQKELEAEKMKNRQALHEALTKQGLKETQVPGVYQTSNGQIADLRDVFQKTGYATNADAAPKYETADDVKAAYKAGKLTKKQAAKVLREQFKFQ